MPMVADAGEWTTPLAAITFASESVLVGMVAILLPAIVVNLVILFRRPQPDAASQEPLVIPG